MLSQDIVIGIDCGKDWLDAAIVPNGNEKRVRNDAESWLELAAWAKAQGVSRFGVEASGGYERGIRATLWAAGMRGCVFDPKRVRHFAKAKGRHAKNDRIDARIIGEFTATLGSELCTAAPDIIREDMSRMLSTRDLVVDKRADLKRALGMAPEQVREALQDAIADLSAAIDKIDAGIERLIDSDPGIGKEIDRLKSAPGVGDHTARILAAKLPELGRVDRRQISALAGLAPYDDDSGRRQGARHISGGRADVRRSLYMAVVAAATGHRKGVLADYYRHLRAQGKEAKVALTACMRKLLVRLNAMMAKGEDWRTEAA
ncbi:MAG TPA: transposase [Rhizobium sp.]|nr:transposase [Rhizobium sp.]